MGLILYHPGLRKQRLSAIQALNNGNIDTVIHAFENDSKYTMSKEFNQNILKAMKSAQEAIAVCKQAMVDANDESCRAMYSAIMKDCEKHIKMLEGEIKLHKDLKKWDTD